MASVSNTEEFVLDFQDSGRALAPIEGDLTHVALGDPSQQAKLSPVPSQYPSTIDEPVKDTILRDVKAVGIKCYHVFVPRSSNSLLKDWDLWGPLILCTLLAMILQHHSSPNDAGSHEFAQVFCIFWVGAAVVTLNARLLGWRRVAFLQSVCVLGYCVLPLLLALLACRLALLFRADGGAALALFLARCLAVTAGLAWSVFASSAFLADGGLEGGGQAPAPREASVAAPATVTEQPAVQSRKALVLYPVALFYTVIGWMVLSDSG